MKPLKIVLLLAALALVSAGCADFGTSSRQDIYMYQGTSSPPFSMVNGDIPSSFPPYHHPDN